MCKLLQVTVFLGAWVPVLAGLTGIILGPVMLGDDLSTSPSFDSHYAYLSGLLLAIGLGFWSTIRDIENKTQRFQILTALVFIGGLGRLYALISGGIPNTTMLFALVMELVVTPLLGLWQHKVAKTRQSL